MARKSKAESEGQLDLIDVQPENAKKIKRLARAWLKAHDAQLAAKMTSDGKMDSLMEAVTEAELQPLADGTIRFRVEGMVVKVGKPKSRVTVKEQEEEPGDDSVDDAEFDAEEPD